MPFPESLAVFTCVAAACITLVSGNSPPRFSSDFPSVLVLPEDTPMGSYLSKTLKASDPDPGDNNRLIFSISGDIGNSLFGLERVSSTERKIKLKIKLDKETISQYTVYFVVSDGVNTIPKKSSVYVTNVNDVAPRFQNLPYDLDLPEDTPVGSTIFTVTAYDLENDFVTYFFLNGKSFRESSSSGPFTINQNTGEIRLTKKLDYEQTRLYTLDVLAKDPGGLNDTTTLVVQVVDVEDSVPVFTKTFYTASVPEASAIGTIVLRVKARNGDIGNKKGHTIVYSFGQGAPSWLRIDSNTGVIQLTQSIHAEDNKIIQQTADPFTVIATEVTADGKLTSSKAMVPVYITVLDVNDNGPSFSQNVYNATFPLVQNTPSGVAIEFLPLGTFMFIKDNDTGYNAKFEIYLTRNGKRWNALGVFPRVAYRATTVMIHVKDPPSLPSLFVNGEFEFQVVAREIESKMPRYSMATVRVLQQ